MKNANNYMVIISALLCVYLIGYQNGSPNPSLEHTVSNLRVDVVQDHPEKTLTPRDLIGELKQSHANLDESEFIQQLPIKASLQAIAEEIVNTIEPNELMEFAASTTFLDYHELQTLDDPVDYLKRLFSIATASPEIEVGPGSLTPLVFTTRVNGNNSAEFPQETFSTDTAAIYATFQSLNYLASGRVIVRWFDMDRNKIVSFQRYAINSQQQHHYLWARPPQGWQAGAYEVAIFHDDEALTKITQGRFYVVTSDT